MSVEPKAIADLVESFINDEHEDARKYSNRTLLDSSSAWTLHQLAADIYAAGFEEGLRTSEARERGTRQRKFDADAAALEPTPS
jgi:hypothetical protein